MEEEEEKININVSFLVFKNNLKFVNFYHTVFILFDVFQTLHLFFHWIHLEENN